MGELRLAWAVSGIACGLVIVSGLGMVNAYKQLEEAVLHRDAAIQIAEEAIGAVKESAELPPTSMEAMADKKTGNVLIRVNKQHIFEFEGICNNYGGL